MHELSLALEVIELAKREVSKRGLAVVTGICLEAGELSGVDVEAFRFALEMSVPGTLLQDALIDLREIPGTGHCQKCRADFSMHRRSDGCPGCGTIPFEIRGGEEFRVVSLVAE